MSILTKIISFFIILSLSLVVTVCVFGDNKGIIGLPHYQDAVGICMTPNLDMPAHDIVPITGSGCGGTKGYMVMGTNAFVTVNDGHMDDPEVQILIGLSEAICLQYLK